MSIANALNTAFAARVIPAVAAALRAQMRDEATRAEQRVTSQSLGVEDVDMCAALCAAMTMTRQDDWLPVVNRWVGASGRDIDQLVALLSANPDMRPQHVDMMLATLAADAFEDAMEQVSKVMGGNARLAF